jgi:hypothetical protein
LGAQITNLFIGLFCFYYYSVKLTIPNVLAINKLRIKKHSKNIIEKINTKKELTQFLRLVNYKLKVFIQKI